MFSSDLAVNNGGGAGGTGQRRGQGRGGTRPLCAGRASQGGIVEPGLAPLQHSTEAVPPAGSPNALATWEHRWGQVWGQQRPRRPSSTHPTAPGGAGMQLLHADQPLGELSVCFEIPGCDDVQKPGEAGLAIAEGGERLYIKNTENYH